ncbi:4-coumarate--CoA ligase-like 9 [Nicotiana tabacum]|uniref:4-coumarate--CoA ligase-like 9 n=2 Tax=Nicotiana TaxID=4085 RepID=A0A1S3ZTJ1_TOBAC|nr:PREDICTED: 4-coumarate--CoA ligase-like 9 [Nicotiana sylvestris]XP_016467731.1 PREDICTED: 4-coumarate--CoA ligase-like 9 [Nicotiana tabacum]
MDPRNGYCPQTKTFHSLRQPVPLPPLTEPLSIIQYTLSLLNSPTTGINVNATTFLIDATTGHRLSYADFLQKIQSLASSLQTRFPSLSKNDVAFVLSPPSPHIPIVYFALLSLGIVVSPANPLSSTAEVSHMIQLCKPAIAFATSSTAVKLPSLPLGTILLDSPEFLAMIQAPVSAPVSYPIIHQSDSAAILYSSGTTGKVKGVELTHRNLIALITGLYYNKFNNAADEGEKAEQEVSFMTLPMFHVFGFFMLIRLAAFGETVVIIERFDFEKMLEAVEKYRVTYIPVSPPLVVAMAKSDLALKYDLSSLKLLACGGAPLGKEVAERFKSRFPNVMIIQGYGLTETTGGATGMSGPEESDRYGSAGRLAVNAEAKIVDPDSGETLPPGQRGELWIRGPTIMKGYVGDKQATSATLDSEGWLKTGDLCYFDADGFLYVVDRLKELIKYKAYQVPPAELEHLLQSIPDVADAAVIPYPDEEAGEIPMAYIVRRPGSTISESQIIDAIAKQVAPYKKIRRVAFINAIPKSPAGKILRRELVNHASSGASARL